MKRILNNWWAVPLYCAVASVVCMILSLILRDRLVFTEISPGTTILNEGSYMAYLFLQFLLALLVGGLCFFQRMPQREIFWSATILVAADFLLGLLQGQLFDGYWTWRYLFGEWDIWFVHLFAGNLMIEDARLFAFLVSLPPYLFVLFGQKPGPDT